MPARAARSTVLVVASVVALLACGWLLPVVWMSSPDARHGTAALDIAILVFREGLECVLVLAAVTANMTGPARRHRRAVFAGSAVAAAATLATWTAAVRIVSDLNQSLSALEIQALTGLLAVVVLLLVMNWFFHRVYWTGWISLHSRKKEDLLRLAAGSRAASRKAWWGLALLGFTSFYREGFEVVLFLQSYRLRLGNGPVTAGVLVGLVFTALVAVLTFIGHRRLAYRKMLVLTGVMLGVVLLVMVGEQAQEMQMARWLPTTPIAWLAPRMPEWLGMWFAVFPTVETLAAQVVAAALVLLSFAIARPRNNAAGRGAKAALTNRILLHRS